jgi:hypothetical protein
MGESGRIVNIPGCRISVGKIWGIRILSYVFQVEVSIYCLLYKVIMPDAPQSTVLLIYTKQDLTSVLRNQIAEAFSECCSQELPLCWV